MSVPLFHVDTALASFATCSLALGTWLSLVNPRPLLLVFVAVALLTPYGSVCAQAPEPTVRFTLGMQTLYTHGFPDEGESSGSFSARRFRPGVTGSYGMFSFRVMPDLAGPTARLVDAWITYQFNPYAALNVGQGKVPFVRQYLNSYLRLQFVDISLASGQFNEGRQPGIWLNGRAADNAVEYVAGVFNGEGMNRANENEDLLQVARVAWAPLGTFALAESSLDYPSAPRLSIGASVMSKTEGEGEDSADLLRFGAEAAFKLQGFNTVGEVIHERADPEVGGRVNTIGWYTQVGYLLMSGYEVALRYSVLSPDAPDGVNADEIETGVGFSRYFEGHNIKIHGDLLQIEDKLTDTKDSALRMQLQVAF